MLTHADVCRWWSDSSLSCRISDGVGTRLTVKLSEGSHVARILETKEEPRLVLAQISSSSRVIGGGGTVTVQLRANTG
jgi:hypothetical protein